MSSAVLPVVPSEKMRGTQASPAASATKPPVRRLLFSRLFAIAAVLGCTQAARSVERTLAYDDGVPALTTVLGLYAPEQVTYVMGTDFSIMWTEDLKRTTVLVHVHVGSKLKPITEGSEPKLTVTVNDGAPVEKSLAGLEPDQNQWVEVDVPVDVWRVGANQVAVSSNVQNQSNMSAESVDILASSTPPFSGRSWYTTDRGRVKNLQRDRNQGIRLRLETTEEDVRPARVTVTTDAEEVGIHEPTQFVARAVDETGRPVNPGKVEWSATGGVIDDGGLFMGDQTGAVEVTATAAGVDGRTRAAVVLKAPFGVEPPDSPLRLGSRIPDGHVGLSGRWEFALDPDDRGVGEKWQLTGGPEKWGEIVVPGCWQAQGYGTDYHGIGWYRRKFTVPEEWMGRNVWVRFGAAATHATVWVNGREVGSHLGNWVPFEFDLTEYLNPDGENHIVVKVEELPERFSAGFSREVGRMAGTDSHFGGLWQDVSLFATGESRVSDMFVVADLQESTAEVRAELSVSNSAPVKLVCSILDAEGNEVARQQETFAPSAPAPEDGGGWSAAEERRFRMPIPDVRKWSPDDPYLYTCVVKTSSGGVVSDSRTLRFGMRSMERRGSQLLLNDEPLFVRGALHWAYYPDLITIDPSEERIRKEFDDLRAAGFNMVKPCLLMFPPRFYEIADETGMLIWQEYPVWLYLAFPKEGDDRLNADFHREYPEWFRFDRRYTSVVLRDLTCEAHEGSNWDLLKSIYAIGKRMTDDALICDNSSFMHHAITDWYDCHIYRDLDQFYDYLVELAAELRSKEEVLPYLSGEDVDADTYRDSAAVRDRFIKGEAPWWLRNHNFTSQLAFDESLRRTVAPEAPEKLVRTSNLHALALRKAYLEDFRRYPELAGYIMTQIRDITVTRPGFYDDLGQQKHTPEEWKRFNEDRVLIFHSPRRSRCFRTDEVIDAQLILSNFGASLADEPLRWKLSSDGGQVLAEGKTSVTAERGKIVVAAPLTVKLPAEIAETAVPLSCRLEAEVGAEGSITRNDWRVWLFPATGDAVAGGADGASTTYAYSPTGSEGLAEAFPAFALTPVNPDGSGNWTGSGGRSALESATRKAGVLVTDALDDHVKKLLEAGDSVVLVAHDGESSGLPRQEVPFWRETAVWIPKEHPAINGFPHEEFVDLQFLDMTQRRPFVLEKKDRESIEPIIWGTSARNPGSAIYDYLFEQQVGRGRLIACSLDLTGSDNIAGQYLLRSLIAHAEKAGER